MLSSRGELRQILERDLPKGFKSADEFFKTFDESNKVLEMVSKTILSEEAAELNKEMTVQKQKEVNLQNPSRKKWMQRKHDQNPNIR